MNAQIFTLERLAIILAELGSSSCAPDIDGDDDAGELAAVARRFEHLRSRELLCACSELEALIGGEAARAIVRRIELLWFLGETRPACADASAGADESIPF